MQYPVTIITNKKVHKLKADRGTNLLTFLNKNGFNLSFFCGGQGICGKCRVKFISNPPKPEETELLTKKELENGLRLACKISINQPIKIKIFNGKEIAALTTHENNFYNNSKALCNPLIQKKFIDEKRDDNQNKLSYLETITNQLDFENVNYNSLKKLEKIKKNEKTFSVIYNRRNKTILDIENREETSDLWGLAVDIGTTTIAFYLVNLFSGKVRATFSLNNSQQKYGADIISRIQFSEQKQQGKEKLQNELINCINDAVSFFKNNQGIKPQKIYQCCITGNTTLLHFLLKLDTGSLARSPFTPLFTDYIELVARDLDIQINSSGIITLMPAISGYLGADITAGILAVNKNTHQQNNYLLIDIGTNGEIVLKKQNNYYSCSTAAGPAFEGTNITFGIPGIPGAISSYEIKNNAQVSWQTIENKKPAGICGSGLLDIIVSLLKHNLITPKGKIKDENNILSKYHHFLARYEGQKAIKIIDNEELYITQKDIREVQMAKGAIATGVNLLLTKANQKATKLDNIFLAGGFGNYLNPENACKIGLIPELQQNKIKQIGNTAGMGAIYFLLNFNYLKYIKQIKENINYYDLSSEKTFQSKLIEELNFPE